MKLFGDVMRNKDSMMSTLASGVASPMGIAAQQLVASELTPRETEVSNESSEATSDDTSLQVDQSKPRTTTIQLDQHTTKSSNQTP